MIEIPAGYTVAETEDFARRALFGAPFESQAPVPVTFIDPELLGKPLDEWHYEDGHTQLMFTFSDVAKLDNTPRALRHLRPVMSEVLAFEHERSDVDMLGIRFGQFAASYRHPDAEVPHLDYGRLKGSVLLRFSEVEYVASNLEKTTVFVVGKSTGVPMPKRKIMKDQDKHFHYFLDHLEETFEVEGTVQPEPGEVVISNGLHLSPRFKKSDKRTRTLLRLSQPAAMDDRELYRFMNRKLTRADMRRIAEAGN